MVAYLLVWILVRHDLLACVFVARGERNGLYAHSHTRILLTILFSFTRTITQFPSAMYSKTVAGAAAHAVSSRLALTDSSCLLPAVWCIPEAAPQSSSEDPKL